ncbi:MAG: lysophospholipid acyltransferase family protein [Prevotellaceae bacterium]|jgi:KDO2-lipid IV(A) lauroyltransferase|nr:lysophospholipid acyltransferase family protein [Prevotellaceae bacterium]
MLHKILYYPAFAAWWLASLLPMRVLYVVSDILYWLIYHLFRYRRRIVFHNISSAFPELSAAEHHRIERSFYRFFGDYLMETVKYFSMGERQIRRRMTFGGLAQLQEDLKHRDCIVYMGHVGNWEWVTSLPLYLDASVVAGQIYHALENRVADRLFLRMRERFRAVSIEMQGALRPLVRYKQQHTRFIVGFITDQSPNWPYVKMWTEFLHHKSAFFTGAESIAKATDAVVYYLDMHRVKRGYYHADFVRMSDTPNQTAADYELTVDYARRLEQTIRRDPACWLWSHNRWKRTYEQYVERQKG